MRALDLRWRPASDTADKVVGCDKEAQAIAIARRRIEALYAGTRPIRPLGKPVYQPSGKEKTVQIPEEWKQRDHVRAPVAASV